MTPADIIRAAIPGATDSDVEHVVWGRTAFPMASVSARDLYRAASRLQRATANGIRLCDFCDRIARTGDWMCVSCDDALRRAAA